jgi:outer membrane receptor protein involved in Fe transport
MGQQQNADGSFLYDPGVGDLKIQHYFPEYSKDRWGHAALTVEGKVANLDVVYAGAFLKRRVESAADYTDYSFFYDTLFNYGQYYVDDAGNVIDPSQYTQSLSRYTKQSHEIRVSTPAENRWRLVAGVFGQHPTHQIQERYRIDGIGAQIEVPGWEDTIWLTRQKRVDRDYAIFGEFAFDFTDKLTGTAGIRFFEADNTLKGFFGYGAGFSGSTGEAACFAPGPFKGAPCVNLDKKTVENGNTPKVNLTYKFDADRMVYVTYSEGFRRGGINRRATLTPYGSDYLKNYEVGWKTTWGGAFRFNGAVFWQKWNDFQYSYLGPNAFTIVTNAGGARIKGVEGEVEWVPTQNLQISGGFAFTDAKLTQDFCKQLQNGQPLPQGQCPDIGFAASGTRLPVTPRFKANLTGRYGFPIGGLDAHVQASVVYAGARNPSLLPAENEILGRQASYTIADVSAGVQKGNTSVELFVNNAFDRRADLYRFAQCPTFVQWSPGDPLDKRIPLCGQQPYTVTNTPRTVGIKFGQRF